jgi:hypothetical protein
MSQGTALQQDAINETYEDVRNLIYSIVHQFIRRHGHQWGTFDELLAQANWDFMVAYEDHGRKDGNRSSTSSFSSWCYWVVSKGLLEQQRTTIRRDRQCRIVVCDMTPDILPGGVSLFQFIDLLDELNDDARQIVRLVFRYPETLLDCMRSRKGCPKRNAQAVIRQYLYGCDWTPGRVTAAFENITSHLN